MVKRSGVKVGGQGQWSRSWGQGQGHDWWSQGRGSRSVVKVRYRSWGQVGRGLGSRSGVKVVVKIGGQGQESR